MSKYGTDIISALLWGGLIFIGLILFIVTLIRNIIRFRKEQRPQNFFTTYLILGFTTIICGIEYKIQYDLDKPSLLRVHLDDDINDTSIDLKLDGSFICDDSTMLSNTYEYGNYTIKGNKIILDKSLEYGVYTKFLEIRHKEFSDDISEKKLIQVDEQGKVLPEEAEFKVIEDNRKQPLTTAYSVK
jgi:hypothetical protein